MVAKMMNGDDATSPLVSVVCTTYNHEKYICQCLDGFVMQKTTFPIEIIVHDDASTDGTVRIVKEYEEKYPNLFNNIYRTENWYSQGKNIWEYLFTQKARGKYIAICEGDDYWIDPYKLQKQVDFLEGHPEYGLVHTEYKMLNESKNFFVRKKRHKFDSSDVTKDILRWRYGIGTLTILFRRKLLTEIPKLFTKQEFPMGDLPLWIEISSKSKIYFCSDTTSVYRILPTSASHFSSIEKDILFYKKALECRKFYARELSIDISDEEFETIYLSNIIRLLFAKNGTRRDAQKYYHELKKIGHVSYKTKVFYYAIKYPIVKKAMLLLYSIL